MAATSVIHGYNPGAIPDALADLARQAEAIESAVEVEVRLGPLVGMGPDWFEVCIGTWCSHKSLRSVDTCLEDIRRVVEAQVLSEEARRRVEDDVSRRFVTITYTDGISETFDSNPHRDDA